MWEWISPELFIFVTITENLGKLIYVFSHAQLVE